MRAAIRELDQRTSDGITVSRLWNTETNRVFVSVAEERHGVSFEFAVPADAFHQPYAYGPARRGARRMSDLAGAEPAALLDP